MLKWECFDINEFDEKSLQGLILTPDKKKSFNMIILN